MYVFADCWCHILVPPSYRLFHSHLAQPKRQAFACRSGWARGQSVTFVNQWKFPSVTWDHNSMGHEAIQTYILYRPIIKAWCQSTSLLEVRIGGRVSRPTASLPSASRLGLWSSATVISYQAARSHPIWRHLRAIPTHKPGMSRGVCDTNSWLKTQDIDKIFKVVGIVMR